MLREDHYKNDNQVDNTTTTTTATTVTTTKSNNNCDKIMTTTPSYQLPRLYKSLSSLSKFYKKHCVWPHCWASIVRQYHPILKCNKRSHAACNLRQRRHLLGFHCMKAVRRFNKHKHRHLHLRKSYNTKKEQLQEEEQQQQQIEVMEHLTPTLLPPTATTSTTTTKIQHAWTPPVNYDTLKELSVNYIFKSLQLRHDLLFDPNLCFRPNLDGPTGRDKTRKAERYWKRVDRAFKQASATTTTTTAEETFDFIKVILKELARILVSFMCPFESSPASGTSFPWSWPTHTTKNQIHDTLDADLIIQQLRFKLPIDNQVNWLYNLFESLLIPVVHRQQHQQRLIAMKRYFQEQRYAKALKQCFNILEIIKLDCANRVLRHYRSFLIETCAEFEYRCFMKQYERKEMKIDSIYQWMKQSYQRYHSTTATTTNEQQQDVFGQVYYRGLVHLVTDDYETTSALGLQCLHQFPTTLQFDEKRLTHQFRYEFQNMIVIAIIMVPYRHLVGKYAHTDDVVMLKKLYTSLLKDASVVANEQICGSKKNKAQVSCYQLALHACHTAIKRHEKNGGPISLSSLVETTKFWEEWLSHHLKPTSGIFKLMYVRICGQLVLYAKHGALSSEPSSEVTGLKEELEALGTKLKQVADLNLETFGVIYKSVAKCVQDDLSQ